MPGKIRAYYWDSNIFFAWLKDEQRPAGEMQGVREYIQRLKKEEINIAISALALTEIRRGRIADAQMKMFERVLLRKNLVVIDVDRRIGKLAGELKDYYGERADEFQGKTLSTPDAIHLATAIIYRVQAFHTFDSKNRKSLGLLPLNGNVAGHSIVVCKPMAGEQPELDF